MEGITTTNNLLAVASVLAVLVPFILYYLKILKNLEVGQENLLGQMKNLNNQLKTMRQENNSLLEHKDDCLKHRTSCGEKYVTQHDLEVATRIS